MKDIAYAAINKAPSSIAAFGAAETVPFYKTDSWKHAPGRMTTPRRQRAEAEECCAMIVAQN